MNSGANGSMATVGFGVGCEQWRFGACPYGQPVDLLWVRETFTVEDTSEHGIDMADPPLGPTEVVDRGSDWGDTVLIPRYRASEPDTLLVCDETTHGDPIMRWRSPIQMPKRYARLWLRVKNVRVERLCCLDYDDLYAEGIVRTDADGDPDGELSIEAFAERWDSLNAKRGYG